MDSLRERPGVWYTFSALKANLPAAFAIVLALSSAFAGEEAPRVALVDEEDEPDIAEMPAAPQSAADVLYGTLSRLPAEPVRIAGSLILRKRHGIVVKEVPYEIDLRWGDSPATATYRLFDAFGRPVRVFNIARHADGRFAATVTDGAGATNAPPALTDAVEGTDITWLDITLSYLWWKDAELAGADEFRGALCDIVLVRPPEPIPGCAAMRLWVDRKRGFLRQAEQINEQGERVRWMWVASVGKINDRWMIRNMEVKRPGTGVMTKLHVDRLETP